MAETAVTSSADDSANRWPGPYSVDRSDGMPAATEVDVMYPRAIVSVAPALSKLFLRKAEEGPVDHRVSRVRLA